MDVEQSWGCRIHSEMHQSSSSASASMHSSMLCSAGDDDAWECFPCPFCYVDVEVPILCNHLQEEHCFDMKNAVCPVCAANAGKDMIGHFTVQHSHLLKRLKSQKTSLSPGSLANVEKEAHEFSSFVIATTNRKGDDCDSAPDPLLSSFMQSISFSDCKGDQEASSDTVAGIMLMSSHVLSSETSIPKNHVLEQEDYKERSVRAEFVQQLLASTIF